MKTKPISKNVVLKTFSSLLFLFMSFVMTAQCPTIMNPNPAPICDASGYTFADLNAFADTSVSGDGIVWYDAPINGTSFNPNQLVSAGTYFADGLSGTCGVRSAITVSFEVAPSGENLDAIYCNNESPVIQTYIDDILNASIPAGGSVQVFQDFELTDLANPVESIPLGPSNYYIVFIDNMGCRSQLEIGQVGVFNAPDAPTPQDPQEFCATDNATIGDLDPGTTATNFVWFADVDGNGDPIPPALQPATALADGETYYIQVDDIFCVSDAVPVTVNIDTPVSAGSSAILEFCNDNLRTTDFDLFDELSGIADPTGTWSGPLPTTNGNRGTVNISGLTVPDSYTFTYTVTSGGVCPDGVSSVIIIVNEELSSGTVAAANPASFCEAGRPAAFDLFSLLDNEDPNGQWTQGTSSTDPVVNSSLDLTGFAPATYNFTYTQNLLTSCPNNSRTVQVSILADPNAGLAVNQTLCENDLSSNSPFNLFDALDGSQDNNTGVWRDATDTVVSNSIDISGFTTAGSPFLFTYTIDNGTCLDTEQITISVVEAPESGTPVPTFPEFCQGEAPANFDLFDLIDGEDQTGTWFIGANNSGASTTNNVDLSVLPADTYNFTYDVSRIGTCDDPDITVTIVIQDTPAPNVTATQVFCDSATIADLVATGTTIQWYENATGGSPLEPSTALVSGADYFATQTNGTTTCESTVRSQVDVTINQSPNAGALNTNPIFICNTANVIDLFTGLDGTQDTNGIWEDTEATGRLTNNLLDVNGLAPDTYDFAYVVTGVAPCLDDRITITVTVERSLNAGSDASIALCSSENVVDLFTLLGTADPGGVWSPALESGTGVLNPEVDATGVYTYTLTNSCGTETSAVTATITEAPNAGLDNALTLCVIDASTDLFTLLGADAQTGGVWSPALESSTGIFNPELDQEGVYTYTVTSTAPCPLQDTAEIVVIVNDTPPATVVNTAPEFCLVDAPTVADLDASLVLVGTVTWYEDEALTQPLLATEALATETYYATQTNASGCESSRAVVVNAIVNDTPTPTLEDPEEVYCINDDPGPSLQTLTENIFEYDVDLENVVWYDVPEGGERLSIETLLAVTSYYAALIDPVTGCESALRLEVAPDITACGLLEIPDGFSPNGDGNNDTFDMDNIAIIHPNFDIEIFNRNGNIVYKGNANTPRFDGTSNQNRVAFKGDLPVGVYFYIFNFNDGENNPVQGRLYLSR